MYQLINEELIEDLIEWEGPRRVRTARGERELYTGLPTSEFWSLWRNSKEELKALGVSVTKNDATDEFEVMWWRLLSIQQDPRSSETARYNTFTGVTGSSPVSWDFSKVQLNGTEKFLRPYQVDAVKSLCLSICDFNFVLNASEVGLGKTYQALAVAKWLGWPVGIICPAALKSKWEETALFFDILPTFVESYDKLRGRNLPEIVLRTTKIKRGKDVEQYNWALEKAHFLIFDEVHTCGNPTTLNASLLEAAIDSRFHKVLGLSATVSNSPLTLKVIGKALGLHSGDNWWDWCRANGCRDGFFGGLEFSKNTDVRVKILSQLHAQIFPKRGVRLRRRDLNLGLPENIINVEGIDVERNSADWPKYLLEAIEELEDKVKEDEKKAEEKGERGILGITVDLRMRQHEELLKVPYLLDEVVELLEEGMSVIVFASFKKPLELLRAQLEPKGKMYECSVYHGELAPREKSRELAMFQDNKRRVLLCNVDAGAQGLDMDDKDGNFPRVSLICPTYSAVKMIQAMGRTDRESKKSVSTQRLLFASDGVEAKMMKACQEKIDNMALINDGDLTKGVKIL